MPSEYRAYDNRSQRANLPPLLAAHLGRSENGQPLKSSLTFVHKGRQPSINTGGNIPPNSTYLSYNAQPFIPNNLQPSNGPVHTHVNPYSQPHMGVTLGQALNYPSHAQGGNPSLWGTSAYYPYGGYAPQTTRNNNIPIHNGFIQQKKFTKTHLAVHNIKQREGESTRAFVTRTRSLVEFLSTYLPTTYKGLMEKTYTWIKAREVATNGALDDYREGSDSFRKNSSWDNNKGKKNRDKFSPYREANHGLLSNSSKSLKEILATEKVPKTFKQPPRMLRNKQSRDMTKYCHFYEDYGHETNDCHELRHQIDGAVKSGQISHLVKGIKKGKAKDSDTQQGN
ncbi:hypothetical protein Tco_1160047 [Tanacetum coccineum]